MSPQRRTALVSVAAAAALIALKLATGLATHSLGLVSEAVHSGTDLVAALLTFFAVGVAGRPADTAHTYGHGKAEHLSALAEGAILVAASLVIAERAIERLAGSTHVHVHAAWYALVVVGVVIAVSPGAAVEQGHEAADAVEDAVQRAVPESDVVVHVEPQAGDEAIRERARTAAMRVPRVREIHNVSVLRVGLETEVSLHLKLPGELTLEEAHAIASEVERAIRESVDEVTAVQTHLEPLAEPEPGEAAPSAGGGGGVSTLGLIPGWVGVWDGSAPARR